MILFPVGGVALLAAVFGYRAFKRRRRLRYRVDNVSDAWLADQRRES
jgi:hypothetical protein